MAHIESGSFTGEISPKDLATLGLKYVLIGHSERRNYFLETDELINNKVHCALKNNLIPIICCGEKEIGDQETVFINQLQNALKNINLVTGSEIIIAYEPV
jgi:triosephosphate isomerase